MAGMKDVARHAGVSMSTVSNVINGRHKKMAPETLARVNKAISELKFTPNSLARQLKTGQIKTLGLIVPSVANPFWGNMSHLIEAEAKKRGYQVLICNAERDPEVEAQYVESLFSSSIRGVIIGSSPVSFDHLKEYAEKGMKIAAIDRDSSGAEDVIACSVSIDQLVGAQLAVRHLIGLGHKRIGFISGPIGTTSRVGRLEGMNKELEKAGITPDESLIWGGRNVSTFGDSRAAEIGRTAIRELLTLDNPPTAVLTANDMYAIGACAGARELGYKVPEDLSVVGFDDIHMAEVMQPPLTTIRQPVELMSEVIVRKLIETLESPDEITELHHEVSAELIVRASTAQYVS